MGFVQFLFVGVGAVFATALVQRGLDFRAKKKIVDELGKGIIRLEESYKDLIRKQMMLLETSDDPDVERILREVEDQAEKILMPDLDSLFHLVTLYQNSGVKLKINSTIFHNIQGWVNRALSEENPSKLELHQSIRQAITSDIEKRLLNWKTGHSFLVD
ncbi:MAG: hypothetical protein AAF135_08955 [Bacteroidota bacterium]